MKLSKRELDLYTREQVRESKQRLLRGFSKKELLIALYRKILLKFSY